jgi:RHS repeat-associated protein
VTAHDSAAVVYWRWDNVDPFGYNAPTGTLTLNLRFPGQYFDRETNRHYNYQRDYDPSLGRYAQTDPLGFGGVSSYAYAENSPQNYTDPLGLDTLMCTRPINVGFNVPRVGPVYHQFISVPDGKGGRIAAGLSVSSPAFNGPGVIVHESNLPATCVKVADDNACIEHCIKKELQKPPPRYSLFVTQGPNCQTWANGTFAGCQLQCKK